jgi:hypothetical protein
MVSLDLEKAYDTAWIYGLLYKLISLQLPPYIICILRAFLVGRSSVRLNNASSTPQNTLAGLTQGAVLSTTVFAIYTSDMPHPSNIQLALYADDSPLRAILAHRHHRPTTHVCHWHTKQIFHKMELHVKVNKTEAILFTKLRPAAPPTPISTYLSSLESLSSITRPHARSQTPFYKIPICRHTGPFLPLFPLLARDSTLSLHNKLALYKLMICPILTHAAPAWSNTSLSKYRQVQILQSKCFVLTVTTLDVPLFPTFIRPFHSNPFIKLFIVWEKIFFTTVPHTPTLSFAK